MRRWEKISYHLLACLVAASGLLYLWMKYALEKRDPFSVIHHPLQPWMLALHILAAPLLVLMVGVIVASHVGVKLAGGSRSNRGSGLVLLFSFLPMVLSGYLLQVCTDPFWLGAARVVHVASGLLFFLGSLVHQWVTWRLERRRAPESSSQRQSLAA